MHGIARVRRHVSPFLRRYSRVAAETASQLGRVRLLLLAALALVVGCLSPSGNDDLGLEGDLLFVVNRGIQEVWGYDLGNNNRIGIWSTGAGPTEMAVSPNERWIVIANYGNQSAGNTLTVIAVSNFSLFNTISLGPNGRPNGMAFMTDDNLAVTSELSRTVVLVNVPTGITLTTQDTEQDGSHLVVVEPENDYLWTSNSIDGTVSRIPTSGSEDVWIIPTDPNAEALALSPDGTRLWVGSGDTDRITVVNTQTGEIVERFDVPGYPLRIAFLPEGDAAVVTSVEAGTVGLYDADSFELDNELTIGGSPTSVVLSPDGTRAYVALSTGLRIVIIDTDNMEEVGQLETGLSPAGLAYVPKF